MLICCTCFSVAYGSSGDVFLAGYDRWMLAFMIVLLGVLSL